MAGQSPLLAFGAGVLVGGLVTYAAVTTAQAAPRKTKKKVDKKSTATDATDRGDTREARFVEHRSAVTGPVPLPESANDMTMLDRVICETFREDSALADEPIVLAAEVFERIVGAEAPTVSGDHASVKKLETIIEFRIAQLGLVDEDRTFRQNLNAVCPMGVTMDATLGD